MEFQRDLGDYVLSRLSGSNEIDSEVERKPHETFILGSLAPRKQKEKAASDSKTSIRATSMSVSFLVQSSRTSGKDLSVVVSFYAFYSVKTPNGRIWRRSEKQSVPVTLDTSSENSVDLDFGALVDQVNSDPQRKSRIVDPPWNATLKLSRRPYQKSELLTLELQNRAIESRTEELALFDVRMEIDIEDVNLSEFSDEYTHEGHRQRFFYSLRTENCQAKITDKPRRRIVTGNYATYRQEQVQPRSECPDIDLSFEALSTEAGIDQLVRFQEEMQASLRTFEKMLEDAEIEQDGNGWLRRHGNKQSTLDELRSKVENYQTVLHLYKRGLDDLISDDKKKQAFRLMNRTFRDYFANRHGVENGEWGGYGWRLFQILFIVMNVRILSTSANNDSSVDILHVGTGGGKSEAYFGLIVFLMFHDRLIGKAAGVTALVKFPLRMLSIQQLARLSSVIAYAEKTRSEECGVELGEPFTLGYFVGNREGTFPGLYSKLVKRISGKQKRETTKPQSSVLPDCPLCPEGKRGRVVLVVDDDHQRLLHVCEKNPQHVFRIYLSDRESYRYRPTVLVSTVDKWANLAYQRRARALLGGKGSYCPNGHGFIPSGDTCEDNPRESFQCPETGGSQPSTGPTIQIQDEIHLLEDSFGAIASHFEGLIEEIVRATSHRSIKHVAMSATMTGVRSHIKELYNKRNSIVIPGPCPGGTGSKFDLFFEKPDRPSREIIGLKPNLRDNHYASLRTLQHLFEFISQKQKELRKEPTIFLKKYGFSTTKEAVEVLRSYILPLTYHLKVSDVRDMKRLEDQVITPELQSADCGKCIGTELTGRSGLDHLKEVIDKVTDFAVTYDPSQTDTFEPVYATSVVSHGVDLDDWNVMVFQGMPYSTSEYIQALSRVGRRKLGIVFVWFYPTRVRDDSFYRNFVRYHETLHHQVQPTPVNRTAKLATMQTINSLFCGGILSYLSEIKGQPLIHKEDVDALTPQDQEALSDFLRRCYGRPVQMNIAKEVYDRISHIRNSSEKPTAYFPNILAGAQRDYYRNQSGMRGLQLNLSLDIDNNGKYISEKFFRSSFDPQEIPEASALFQGYPQRIFSHANKTFRVKELFPSSAAVHEINCDRFRSLIAQRMTGKVKALQKDGYGIADFSSSEIKFASPILTESMSSEQSSGGTYTPFPELMICTKCGTTFWPSEGRQCRCKAPIEQVSFLTFCDLCGEISEMSRTNLHGNCRKCKERKGLRKLVWKRKDEIRSYRVKCIKCGYETALYFFKCNHGNGGSGLSAPDKESSRLRAIPVRSGAATNPLVVTFPDIPRLGDLDAEGSLTTKRIHDSKMFKKYFPDAEEAVLKDDRFRKCLRSSGFLDRNNIRLKLQMVSGNTKSVDDNTLDFIVSSLLGDFHEHLKFGKTEEDTLRVDFGFDCIKKCVEECSESALTEEELQGLLLTRSPDPVSDEETGSGRLVVKAVPSPRPDWWADFLGHLKMKKIQHVSNVSMIQALLGIVYGSTRRAPQVFKPYYEKGRGDSKPVVYVRQFRTEGIVFQFDHQKLTSWLSSNGILKPNQLEESGARMSFRKMVNTSSQAKSAVFELLHTFSHLIIQNASRHTGLSNRNLSEIIYPSLGSVFVYSKASTNIGGLEDVYDFSMKEWARDFLDLAESCPQDPACMEDEGGSCNACSYLPEFVCAHFNQELDRGALVGGPRYKRGFYE